MSAFSYPTVDVGGTDYSSYITLDDANTYLAASIGATSWAGATDDVKGAAIISAVRWLDTADWQGDKADAADTLAWPRSGIEGVDSTTLPTPLVSATAELAAALVAEPDLQASLNNPTPKSIKAGSVALSFFRPTLPYQVQISTLFPKLVMALIGQWLAGAGNAAGGPTSFGTCRKPKDEGDFDFYHGI